MKIDNQMTQFRTLSVLIMLLCLSASFYGLLPISSAIFIFGLVLIRILHYGIYKPTLTEVLVLLVAVISDIFSTVPTALYFSISIIVFNHLTRKGIYQSNTEIKLGTIQNILILTLLLLPFISYDFLFDRLYLGGIGSANYVALIYLTIILTFHTFSKHFSVKSLCVLLALALIYITQSRGAFLALICYIFQYIVIYRYPRLIKISRILLFLLFVLGSLGLGLFSVYLSDAFIHEDRTTFSIFDESNLGRIIGFVTAINTAFKDLSFLYSGLGNSVHILESELYAGKLLPHHWFAMTVVANGWLLALFLLHFIAKLILSIPPKILPYFCVLIIFLLVTGRAAFILSLGLHIIIYWIFKRSQSVGTN